MKYDQLLALVKAFPVFSNDLGSIVGEAPQATEVQLSRWVKASKVIRLKRGLYTLPEAARSKLFSREWLANTLYSPSYLSLEFMLARYDLIPERVTLFTSVSTLKTAQFQNPLGQFHYRHLKQNLFFGFEEHEDEFHAKVLMATPEKALLDYIYLHPHWEFSEQFLEQNIRLQLLGQLRKSWLKNYGERFASKKMSRAVEVLIHHL